VATANQEMLPIPFAVFKPFTLKLSYKIGNGLLIDRPTYNY